MWGATRVRDLRIEALRFQSTLPVWGATPAAQPTTASIRISIHAPRVGSDRVADQADQRQHHFNPRSPCGERLQSRAVGVQRSLFQSTLPVWGATFSLLLYFCSFIFQSTLPVWGATSYSGNYERALQFQSTLPVWGATLLRQVRRQPDAFQSTLPVWGATAFHVAFFALDIDFNPRSPCGERRAPVVHGAKRDAISIHAPRVGSDSKIAQFFACNFAQK